MLWIWKACISTEALFDVFQNVTDPNGPAMTWGMFSVGWLELGNKVKGASLFAKNFNYIQVFCRLSISSFVVLIGLVSGGSTETAC